MNKPLEYKRPNVLFLKGLRLSDLLSMEEMFENRLTSYNIEEIPVAEKTEETYNPIPKYFTTLNKWIKSTSTYCFGCDRTFKTRPIPIPMEMCKNKTGEIEIVVEGLCCSFVCVQAYINLYYYREGAVWANRMNLLKDVYKTFMGKKVILIPNQPSKFLMKKYIGPEGLSEQEYEAEIAHSETVLI